MVNARRPTIVPLSPANSRSPANGLPGASRTEWLLLGGALLLGLVLRCGQLSRVAVEHYDEAVYASNLLFGAEWGHQFPGRQFHAPPLLPAAIEWTFIVSRMIGLPEPAWLPMVPSLFCGVLLIASGWWIARQWFSAVAGVAVAWVIALAEYHAFYSRTALTDPVLTLWFVWAVHWGWKALGDGSPKSAAVAGILTAGAWWTKYNGWLPLAIVLSGGLCDALLASDRRQQLLRLVRVLLVMTAVAAVLWSPVLRDSQAVGGYSAIADNHRGYLQGWAAWPGNWLQQNANLDWYSGPLTELGWVAAFAAAVAVGGGFVAWRSGGCARKQLVLGAVWMAACLGITIAGCPLAADCLTGLAAVAWGCWRWRERELSEGERRAGCLLAAWYAGLMLATPLYQPYPRLCLPWWLAGTLGIGWFLHQSLRAPAPAVVPLPTPAPARPPRGVLAISLGMPVLCGVVLAAFGTTAWESRTAMREAARDLAVQESSPQTVAYVYADPAMVYELTRNGMTALPTGDVHIAPPPNGVRALLVLGPYVDRLSDARKELDAVMDQYELVHDLPVSLSSLVLLDNDSPSGLRHDPNLRTRHLLVYRRKP